MQSRKRACLSFSNNKSDHAGIPRQNAHVYRLIYLQAAHIDFKTDFLMTKTKYEMLWPHVKFARNSQNV